MTMDAITDRIRSVLAATFGVPAASITDATSSGTVEAWDSMNHIHLLVALEGEFGISFEPEQAVELTSVSAIRQALTAHGVE